MIRMRLKGIYPGTDFRKNEWTNYRQLKKHKQFQGELSAGETYLLISKSGNQLLWLLGVAEINGRTVIDSRRWRITNGTWHYMMLAEYAVQQDIELIGHKRLREHVKQRKGT